MTESESPQLPPRIKATPPLLQLITQAIVLVLAFGGALGVLVVSLGWSYAWHWFTYWGVPFASLNLKVDLLLEYGRLVIVHSWCLALLWVVIVVVVGVLLRRMSTATEPLVLLVVMAFLIPWLSSSALGAAQARDDLDALREANFSGLPEVQMFLHTERTTEIPKSILAKLSTGPHLCYRLVFRAHDGLWLVKVNDLIKVNSAGVRIPTIFLPHTALTYLRLQTPKGAKC